MQSEPAGVGVSDEEAALAEGNHNRVQEQRDCWEINPSSHKSQMVEIKKMFSAQRASGETVGVRNRSEADVFLGGYNTCIVNLQNTKD